MPLLIARLWWPQVCRVTVCFACMYAFHLIRNSRVSPLYFSPVFRPPPLPTCREKPWPYSFYPWVVSVGLVQALSLLAFRTYVQCNSFLIPVGVRSRKVSLWVAALRWFVSYKDTNIHVLRSMFLVWLYFALSFKTSQWWLPLNALPFIKTYHVFVAVPVDGSPYASGFLYRSESRPSGFASVIGALLCVGGVVR